jgi:hypothetical protein
MENIREDEYVKDNQAYHKLVDRLGALHNELIRVSQGKADG